jgi:hypothetical protein
MTMSPKQMLQGMVLAVTVALPAAASEGPTSLEQGYRLMYGLDFASAGRVFLQWRADHPRDPLGPMSEAASLLFAELDRTGILQAQFFVNDSSFTSKKPPAPPAAGLRERFDATLASAETLARARLRDEPRDSDALFALTMVYGLRADYAALIEGRGMAALSYTRQATRLARTLLEVAPDYADAYLSTGISQYIVGSLVAPLRWLLRIAGFSGDKAKGIEELKLTAERGRFLGPFARILLTIAYLREHDMARAQELLVGLQREFPSNPLFARELQRISGKAI